MSVTSARRLRVALTDAERKLWRRLRNSGLDGFKFRRQAPLGPYVLDFFCEETRLVVEVDGGQHARNVEGDAERTAWLEARGCKVLRVRNSDVLRNIEGVLATVRAALPTAPHPARSSTAPTSPLGKGYLARFDETRAVFDGLADNYDRHRPDYPAPVVAAWRAHLDRGRRRPGPRVVVDLGCGTGISTRALARALDADDILIGAEPSTDMRAEFRANPDTAVRPLVAALGERLPLAGASLDAIVVAQAAHWMDRSALLAEANHALVPGGTFAFLNNNRLWPGSAFLGAYEDVLERLSPGYRRDYRAFDYAAELDEVGAIEVIVRTHMWDRAFDADDFLGLVRSTSMYKNAAKAHERSTVEAEVRSLVAAHADGAGRVVVAYETELVAGRLA